MNAELTCDDVWQCEDCTDCICESDKKPNFLCMEHQCCWACSTQKGLIHLNQHLRLWLCDGCNDKGDWCRGCHKLIDEDGMCSPGCDYYQWEGCWTCDRCNTEREDEKYCADCGPDPADVAADAEEQFAILMDMAKKLKIPLPLLYNEQSRNPIQHNSI